MPPLQSQSTCLSFQHEAAACHTSPSPQSSDNEPSHSAHRQNSRKVGARLAPQSVHLASRCMSHRVSAQIRNSTTRQPRSQSPVYNCSDISHRPQPQTQARRVTSSFFPQTRKTQAATRPPVLLSCALQPTVASHRARLPRHEQEFTHVLWASFRLCCASDAMTRCKPGAARAQLSPRHGCLPAVQQLGLTDGDTWKKPLPLAAVSPPAPVQPGCACSVCPHPADTGRL